MAAAAAALCAATGRVLGAGLPVAAPALAFGGCMAIYNLDRLRDLRRDLGTSPERARFVLRHRRGLLALALAAALLCLPLALSLGRDCVALLLPALALGLLHRRLKDIPILKPLYISGAWLLVVVALPWRSSGTTPGETAGWAATILGSALLANAIASNVRDHEAGARHFGLGPALWSARAVAACGVAAAGLASPAVRPLLAVPLATLAALGPFRTSERYGLWIVDGALLAGAGVALLWTAARATS